MELVSKKSVNGNFVFTKYLSSDSSSADLIGNGWLEICEYFFQKALQLDSSVLILEIYKEYYSLVVKFTNYSDDNAVEIKKIENQITKFSEKTCEFTGKFGVRMASNTSQRVLDPITSPHSYKVVIDPDASDHSYLCIIDELLTANRELKLPE